MFPFDRPNNYNEMLNKIGICTFLGSTLVTILIGWVSPNANAALGAQRVSTNVLGVDVPILYVVPAAVLALAARVTRLHDKLSDLFGLRASFDLHRILVPLAGAVGVVVDAEARTKLASKRREAMQRTFYKYASFEDPQISKALVLSAIDVWTWYWVLIEFLVVLAIGFAVLVVLQSFKAATYIALSAWILTIFFVSFSRVCGAKANNQIAELIADDTRVEALRREFNDLIGRS